MTDLTPMTALGATTARSHDFGALRLSEVPGLALASLALPRGAQTPCPFGLTLPQAGGLVEGGAHAAFWTGPGQWMVAADGQAETDFAARLMEEAPGVRITEQTDGWVAFEIAGGGIDAVLERLVNLPSDATAPGRAARTGLHHMSVFVLRRTADRLTVLGMRSAAGSLWHALETTLNHIETPR